MWSVKVRQSDYFCFFSPIFSLDPVLFIFCFRFLNEWLFPGALEKLMEVSELTDGFSELVALYQQKDYVQVVKLASELLSSHSDEQNASLCPFYSTVHSAFHTNRRGNNWSTCDRSLYWTTCFDNWLIDCPVSLSFLPSIDWLMDWFFHRLIDWLIDGFSHWLTDWLIDWFQTSSTTPVFLPTHIKMTLASFDQLDLTEDGAEHISTMQLLLQHILKRSVALSENIDEEKRKRVDAYRQAVTEACDMLLRFADWNLTASWIGSWLLEFSPWFFGDFFSSEKRTRKRRDSTRCHENNFCRGLVCWRSCASSWSTRPTERCDARRPSLPGYSSTAWFERKKKKTFLFFEEKKTFSFSRKKTFLFFGEKNFFLFRKKTFLFFGDKKLFSFSRKKKNFIFGGKKKFLFFEEKNFFYFSGKKFFFFFGEKIFFFLEKKTFLFFGEKISWEVWTTSSGASQQRKVAPYWKSKNWPMTWVTAVFVVIRRRKNLQEIMKKIFEKWDGKTWCRKDLILAWWDSWANGQWLFHFFLQSFFVLVKEVLISTC